MIIPCGTNAPLYHWPLGTVGLIVLNIAVTLGGLLGQTEIVVLRYGQGLHPLEWVLSPFFHDGIFHLLGNMFFFWIFGFIIEGKIGVLLFVPCYFVIGILQSAIEQLCMLGYTGPVEGSLGASGIMFGLMAMAMVWAPKNDIHCIFLFLFRPLEFDISVAMAGAWYLGWELFDIWFYGTAAGSAVLHVLGALIGGAVGLAMLKLHLVDCDGWDILSIYSDQKGGSREERPRSKEKPVAPSSAAASAFTESQAKQQLRHYLHSGNVEAALRLREKLAASEKAFDLDREELLSIIRLLHERGRDRDSAPLMAEFSERFSDKAERMRLKLAQICLLHLSRPARALELVAEVDETELDERLRRARKQIVAQAEKMLSEGVFELDDGAW